jgi:NAD(P)-dependent dehydrogenase (short-subunit alcohol dehydrogenase family)
MGNRIDGKVCIVTGSGQGMGRASALEMARQGGKVVVTDIKRTEGEATVDLICAEGGEAIFVSCDLRNPEDIKTLMEKAATRFGSIDVLHNNAGIHETDLTPDTAIDELPDEIWNLVYEVNLKAVWLTTKFATPYLKRSKSPAIINAASTGSLVAYPMSGAYCASKGGVMMLTKASAVDLAKYGIRANCYCPGAIDTPMLQKYFAAAEDKEAILRAFTGSHLTPRLGLPEEVGKLACFLASDDSLFINGAAIVIDGGTLAWRGIRDD